MQYIGNQYTYDKTVYVNKRKPVIITCKIHGDFSKVAVYHIRGNGCALCHGNKRKTTEQFIKESIAINGDRYDYSQVNYINAYTKVDIVCRIHGPFKQEPSSHLKGTECAKCSKMKFTKNTSEFIDRAHSIHGDRYDYSNTLYINADTKVNIICKIHGEFQQSVKGHYSGHGCTECAKQYTQSKQELLIIEMLMNLLPDEEILTSISPEWMERTQRGGYINTI